MNDWMLDIETLSTKNDALIWSVGLTPFVPKPSLQFSGALSIGKPNNFMLSGRGQEGRRIDQNTINWTMKYGDAEGYAKWKASNAALIGLDHNFLTQRNHVVLYRHEQLLEAMAGIGINKKSTIWANGGDFDLSMMKDYFEDMGLDVPWSHGNKVCMRSLRWQCRQMSDHEFLPREDPTLKGHNAADDCVYQIRWTQNMLRAISGLAVLN
ncbi:hypothetical protein LOKG_00062 [Loktanella phage pCB2051-A]|uniref:3'-5' exoribonuclease Rv2179c-like domain-containing protein n=1 Tax=Loktanella phage pCB2051-A TaxID=754044 RepID=M4QRN1_9CAUD|nr:hypothetical protein LOKG_00062 [Loktanella phage pCB2051-A]AGH31498.1 hypothetical protein LOKG_00062 [Loktanella phage pCB2051-A]